MHERIVSRRLRAPYSGDILSVKGMAMYPSSCLLVGVIGDCDIAYFSHCAKRATPCV
ncbi:hypothetical protein EMIT0P176_320016 [Pseudomonas sp. IT-P176]